MLGLATNDLCTKNKIPPLTHYKDMMATKNAKVWLVWGLGVTQGHQQHNRLIDHTYIHLYFFR